MPRLPSVDQLERRVPAPAGGVVTYRPVTISPEAAALPAQAQARLGLTVADTASAFGAIMAREQQLVDRTRAEDAFNKLRSAQLDLTIGEQNGFRQKRGADAVNGQLASEWTAKFDDQAKQIGDSLGNDRQRELFKSRAQIASLQYKEDILRHLAEQRNVYDQQVYQGTLAVEQQNVTGRWQDQKAIDTALTRIRGTVAAEAERLGWDPKVAEAHRLAEESKVHSAVLGQAVASGDFMYAKRYYDKNKGAVDAQTAKVVERAVEEGEQKQIANAYQVQFLSGRDSMTALRVLEKKVSADDALSEDRKNMLLGRILSRQDQLEARAERQRAEVERRIGRAIDDINADTLAGFESTYDRMAPILGAAKGTALEGEAQRMVAVSNATRQFRLATPTQQEAVINQAEAVIRQDPSKFDRRLLGAYKQIHEAQKNQVREDPTGFAVRQGLVDEQSPAAAPLDLSKPEALGDQLSARFNLARSVSARYGAPFRPLRPDETSAVVAALRDAAPAQKSEYFAKLWQGSRSDPDGYRAIMGQIAPDDPVSAIAGDYAGKGYRELAGNGPQGQGRLVSDLILAGQALLKPDVKADGKPAGGTLFPMPKGGETAKMQRDFDNYTREAYAGIEQARSDHYQASLAIYAKLSSDAGDHDTAVYNSGRWKTAMKLATGGVERYNSRNVVMPYGYDKSKFEDELATRVEILVSSGRLGEKWKRSQVEDLPLRPIGDGRYLMVAGDGVLVDKRNAPVVIDFNQPAFIPSGYKR